MRTNNHHLSGYKKKKKKSQIGKEKKENIYSWKKIIDILLFMAFLNQSQLMMMAISIANNRWIEGDK